MMMFLPIPRRPLLAFGVLCLCATVVVEPAAAAARKRAPGPRAMIHGIYSREGALNDPALRDRYFSKRVIELWAKSDAGVAPGEIGSVDFDLASNSQGMAVASFKVKTEHADANHVRLAVSLVSRGAYIRESPLDLIVHYDFIREGGRWVIDDMGSTADGEPWTLRGLLGDATP